MTDRPGEDDLIARYFAPLAGPAGLGLKDDAALLTPPPGRDLVLTTDALVAGVHFFADDPPGAIARKALRVNLSDLAAKGAAPLGFLLSLALPAGWTADWLEDFARGLGEDARRVRLPAARRRHRQDARAADAFDHRPGLGRQPAGWPRAPAFAPAIGSMCPARSATPRSACGCGWGRGLRCPRRIASTCSTAICCRDRVSRWRRRCAFAHGGDGRFGRARRRPRQDAARQRR